MRSLDYSSLVDRTWDTDILNLVAKIHECKGRQDLFIRQKPMEVDRLVEIAKIQSTEASNRIEGIKPNNCIQRKTKYVTLDNEKFMRYQGEVCIMLKDLESDERVNVIGACMCSLKTLEMIKPGAFFTFKIIGE